jgi:hypothetical protein
MARTGVRAPSERDDASRSIDAMRQRIETVKREHLEAALLIVCSVVTFGLVFAVFAFGGVAGTS